MTATTIELPEDVRQQVALAAQNRGMSPEDFVVHAVRDAAERALSRPDFVASALAAREQTLRDGTGYAADDVRAWVKARVAGRTALHPAPHAWRT